MAYFSIFNDTMLILFIDDQTLNQYDGLEVLYSVNANGEIEPWDDDTGGGDGDPDTTWEAEHETASNESSVTLSSKMSSKRSISEIELEQDYDPAMTSPTFTGLWIAFAHCIF